MDSKQFNAWLVHYGACFPDTARWLEELDQSQETKKVWREALADVKAEDAKEVTLRMVRGDFESIPNYDREKTPSIIRKYALALGKERVQALPARPDSLRDAYDCRWCRDTGFCYVWSTTAMRLALAEGDAALLPDRQAVVLARCSCARGFPRGALPQEAKPNDKFVDHTPRVGECENLLPIIGLNFRTAENLERLKQKMALMRQQYADRDCSNAFAEWNNQPAAAGF